ncbi:phage terminase small subunit [Achromobacter xylosoxidans]
MTSPAQQHRTRVLAARASAADGDAPAVMGGIYGQMMAKLTQDRRRLHDIQSVERKVAVKRELVPEYADYLQGVLAGDGGQPDEVVTTLMVWHFDIGAFAPGLQLADYVLRHDLQLPERLKRNTATLLLDEVAGQVANGAVSKPDEAMHVLQEVARLVDGQDAPDQARAKLHLALGKTLAAQAGEEPRGPQLEMARAGVAQLRRAVELHSGVGAKKLIEQLDRKIKNAGDAG